VIYLDTSVLGAIFFREPGASEVLKRLVAASRDGLISSAWLLTEMASVGGIKERTGAIDAELRREAMARFQRFVSARVRIVEVDPGDFRTAALLLESPYALRAGDALHLAMARRLKAHLGSLDRRQILAAAGLGMVIQPLTSS
jgi:hypothetical protein